MSLNRRTFTALTAASVMAAVLPDQARTAGRSSFKAIAFDGFPIIDPRPIFARAEEMFPGKGAELNASWRLRQFEYGWLRTLGGRYADFWHVTEDALVFAAKATKIELRSEQRERLMQTYLELKAWPDVEPALRQLRDAGLRMAFLSNLTAPMLDAVIGNSGLEGLLEAHLSTDRVQAFKPDTRAYQMGVDAFGLRKEEIVFAAFAGWDVAGAKWFGYPTFWVNRTNAVVEELGVTPDGMGPGLNELVAFVTA
ncbi:MULTISPECIES: haloacid dehalogenase type II [unclassified Bradyrhizobium]|uniref:haloacid dehalogenase type II n=1 Tax=unclassified Bradyrhizobium TaxID=2631580 RepID=UPI001BAA9EA8|nr:MULTISPECIES: haloacid dehalogenase type II [unclassified Bradyrhizobium]MBR1207641.1 haloacid dehalogenase type II [Bradyrhizobium sp. AUGA SZCCT0124]MBR1317036.1 haloacid dehalogenase type II [Bradyrhizobium sp. AUGA SZCCT0051]MBR1345513.1 haloacid dehalogenase type II [Bradyrhizobium sp. AUGA SZCCT0105]MBR1360135.1 haloacid dehalogenase type II [Bradyrhizobium sp. AUGA SZCCT0045]